VCIHPSIELEYHLLEVEECLRSWESSTNLCTRAQQGIQGAAWGSTCLYGPCEQGPNVVLEATVLRRDRPEPMLGVVVPWWERPEVTLVQFVIL
jgi:hypothetical protein